MLSSSSKLKLFAFCEFDISEDMSLEILERFFDELFKVIEATVEELFYFDDIFSDVLEPNFSSKLFPN